MPHFKVEEKTGLSYISKLVNLVKKGKRSIVPRKACSKVMGQIHEFKILSSMKSIYTAHLSGIDLNSEITGHVTRGFKKYSDFIPPQTHGSRTLNKDKILLKVTEGLLETTHKVIPEFNKDHVFIPRRTLTYPKESSTNFGYDNIMHDYILRVKETLGDNNKYEILDLMGRGTFGQVVKCRIKATGELVAVKVTKREPSFHNQSVQEINTLTKLNGMDKNKFLQLRDSFFFRGHNCAVLELLSISLYKYTASVSQRPAFKMDQIQSIGTQILETLSILKRLNIIHADLKPDNILFKSSDDLYSVKLIDYGSALDGNARLLYPVQTASYRAPEVILGLHYSTAIDMWSFGCLIAEMLLGKSLFPTENEAALLHMMVDLLKHLPPDNMIFTSRLGAHYFFTQNGTKASKTRLKPMKKAGHDIPLNRKSLEQRIMGLVSDDPTCSAQDKIIHKQLLDFLQKILVFDPSQRLTPDDALKHPFITSAAINNTALSPDGIFTNALHSSIKESGSLNEQSRESNIRLTEESGISSISTTSTTIADSNRTIDTPATEIQEEVTSGQLALSTKQPKSILKSKPSNRELSSNSVKFDKSKDETILFDDHISTYSKDRPQSAMPLTSDYKAVNYFYQQPRPKTAAPTLVNYNIQNMALFNEYHSPTVYMAPKHEVISQYHRYPLIRP